MALVQLTEHQRIVCHMSVSGSIWANSFIVKKTGGTTLSGAESVVTKIHDFFKGMTPNAGFIEKLTGYNVYQHHAGDAEIDHPPQWQNTYHEAGTHDATFNGAHSEHHCLRTWLYSQSWRLQAGAAANYSCATCWKKGTLIRRSAACGSFQRARHASRWRGLQRW